MTTQSLVRTALCALLMVVTTCAAAAQALLLFGGEDHKTFLGCLNCNRYSSNSVWNQYGHYGSPFSSDSIWNQYGHWGSQFSSESPWNAYSSTPPVIVDNAGNFYGYFTANGMKSGRTTIAWAVWLLDNHDYVLQHLDEVGEKFD